MHGAVKVPWGPSTCEYRVRRVENGTVKEFKFLNRRRETVCCDEMLLNNLDNGDGVTAFAQRVTAMCVGDKKKLLGNYLSLLQYAENFIFHNPSLNDPDGFSFDASGVTLDEIESNGGSLDEFRKFVKVAEESATIVGSVKEGYSEMVSNGGKRKAAEVATKPVKMSKTATVLHNEKQELEDPDGLESKFSKSFLGAAWIPLDNISIAKDLMKTNIFRVYKIMESFKARYDPSQTVLVVCPKKGEEVNMPNVEEQEFTVVQKCHTLMAFKELDKTNEFETLPGHAERNVLVYVINTNSAALIHYGNARANDIARQHVRTLRPQDLLHIFKSLKEKDGSVNGLKVIERMAKHFRVGYNETTSLLKICKWSSPSLEGLVKVLEVYEVFESSDVKSSGRHTILLQRGEKLSMPNSLFNSLAKCEEKYIEEHFQSVISRDMSLQELVENNQRSIGLKKVALVLSQISGYQSIDKLNEKYNYKFNKFLLADFVGAEVNIGKMNVQAKLLKKYYENVVNLSVENAKEQRFVLFEEVDSLETLVNSDIGSRFETIIVDLKEENQNLCMFIINAILKSDKEQNAGVLIFPTEASQFEVMSFLRSHKITLSDNIKIMPVLFLKDKDDSTGDVTENVVFGIVFGKLVVANPPFKLLFGEKKQLSTLVSQLAALASSVAMLTDVGLPIIQVHNEKLLQKVTYFGSTKDILKFKKVLTKDRIMYDKNLEDGEVLNNEQSVAEDQELAAADKETDKILTNSLTPARGQMYQAKASFSQGLVHKSTSGKEAGHLRSLPSSQEGSRVGNLKVADSKLVDSEEENARAEDSNESVCDMTDKFDESTTSPFKKQEPVIKVSMDDSGIENEEDATSSTKKSLDFDVFNYNNHD